MISSLGNRILWRRTLDYLHTYRPTVIGIAGSIGKTTAKLAASQAIGKDRSVYIPAQPYNDPLGVALGVLGVDKYPDVFAWPSLLTRSLVREVVEKEADTVILELGAKRPGEMDFLARKLPLSVGIVTNVGTQNTNLYGSKKDVAHEMTSLVAALPKEGIAILNQDDPFVAAMAARTSARVVTFGRQNGADVQVSRMERMKHGGFACEISSYGRSYEMHLRHVIGRHQISAILSALALAQVLGIKIQDAIERLQNFTPPDGRLTVLSGKNGARILNDTYDATPESMLSSLETVRAIPAKRKIVILGDITDLGGDAYYSHKRIGKYAGEVAHMVVGIGDYMRLANVEAIMVGADTHHFHQSADAGKWLADYLQPNDLILVSGSRKMQMEKVVQSLKESE